MRCNKYDEGKLSEVGIYKIRLEMCVGGMSKRTQKASKNE